MSLQARLLNVALRLFERRFLARASDPVAARAKFEKKARLFFPLPKECIHSNRPLGGVPATWIEGAGKGVLLYFHGGAYVFGSPDTHASLVAQIAGQVGFSAVLPDYRLAPEAPFPAAFDDALACYKALLDQGVAAADIVIGGDSAGGGLALALLGQICAAQLPQPRGVFTFSAYTDMTHSGPSIAMNEAADVMLPAARMDEIAQMYLQGGAADDPRASPIFADFTGVCPVYLAASVEEILCDDSRRMAAKLRAGGADVELKLRAGMAHVWQIFHRYLPEAREDLAHLAKWITALSSRSDES